MPADAAPDQPRRRASEPAAAKQLTAMRMRNDDGVLGEESADARRARGVEGDAIIPRTVTANLPPLGIPVGAAYC